MTKLDVHPSAQLAIASGAVVLAGLDVASGLIAVRDDEAYLAIAVSAGLRLFAALCVVVALVAAFLTPKRRGVQIAGVLAVAVVAIAVVLIGEHLAREASAFIP
ncbi:hypothetical protein [Microbacterium sp. BDGP8]|uniref:hypothetical protein n=1 Tax=Microbacterium sp. BDGP8 TaxID=3035531 RepID=UPI00249EFED2|nr:hypothetical protein [Microbacterium sp. BDGP8]WHE36982.1 hypothetical protein P6897_04470 [Microbacterium sp. BDGP8]